MMTPFKDEYGFGIMMHDDGGHLEVSHGGGINGFGTSLAWYPEDKIAVVVLDNVAPSTGAPGNIMNQLASVMLGRTVVMASERKEVAADPKVLAHYVGRYQIRPEAVMEITQDGDRLFAQVGKGNKMPIFMESEKHFFSRLVDAQVTFVADGDAPATAIVVHQGGRDTTALRVN